VRVPYPVPQPIVALRAALRRGASFVLLLLLAHSAAGQVPAPRAEGYRLGPKDLLQIQVFEAPEFNSEVRVGEDGRINLPVVGELFVDGLTDHELAARVKTLLEERYVQRATVVIQVKEFRSRPISVIGAVTRPGPLSFSGRWNLLEVLTAAGGLAPQHGDVIYVLRRAENGLSDQLSIRVDDLLVKADRRVNIPIFANDLINVPAKVDVTVFCLGEVQRPGAHVFKSTERITLLTAIARAGGLTDRASRRILIKRGGDARGAAEEIEVDYRRLLAGRVPDVELKEGDVVVVQESFF
jgi:polysaccharide biosynthesis/export protein